MNRRGLFWVGGLALILLVVVGAAALTTVGAGYAKNEDAAGAKCSEATLDGTYLVAQSGFVVKETKKGPPRGPFAVAGYEVYDGNGKVNGVFSFNFDGNVFAKFPKNFRDDGTYTVKADCTGATTYKSGGVRFTTDLFIAPDGSMFTWVQTNPPERVTAGLELRGTAKRVSP
jgi:hypothetical protein